MAKTKKPCPGCGEPEEYGYRDADKVCGACQKLLAEAKAAREQKAADEDLVAYHVPARPWDLPYIGHCGSTSEGEPFSRFREAYHALVDLSGVEHHAAGTFCGATSAGRLLKSRSSSHSAWYPHYLRRASVEPLQQLFAAVESMVANAYAEGKREGEGFIARLATGEVTIQEFNEQTIG